MSESWVLNASPLILFSRIGRLDIFERLTTNVIVPQAVQAEVRAGESHDASTGSALTWAETRHSPDIVVPTSVEHWDLGSGESQVIAHAIANSGRAVLDDRAARRCAEAHGLRTIGSLGVVLRAKKQGVLEHAKPLLLELIDAGMFVDRQLLATALASVQE